MRGGGWGGGCGFWFLRKLTSSSVRPSHLQITSGYFPLYLPVSEAQFLIGLRPVLVAKEPTNPPSLAMEGAGGAGAGVLRSPSLLIPSN